MGVGFDAFFWLWDADFCEGVDGAGECFFSADVFVDFEGFYELVADPEVGVERGHGILEDHGDAFPADAAELFL